MDMEITGQEENPLLGRETFEVAVDHSGEATPSSAKLLKKFGAENDFELSHLTIGSVKTRYGSGRSITSITVHDEEVENVLSQAEDDTEADAADDEQEDSEADEADEAEESEDTSDEDADETEAEDEDDEEDK